MSEALESFVVGSPEEHGACLEVLEVVRRHELNRAGGSVVESDAFAGREVDFALIACRGAGGGPVLGCARLTPARSLAGIASAEAEYCLELVGPLLDRAMVITRLAVLPEHRKGPAAVRLYERIFEESWRRGGRLLLLSCEPGLIAVYESLGARIYGPVHGSPRGGFRVPMVIVMDDVEQLEAAGSPCAAWAKRLGGPRDAAALEWWRGLAARREGFDPGVRPISPADVDERFDPLAGGLSQAGREDLVRHAWVVTAPPGSVVVAEADGGRNLGVLLEGSLEVRIRGERVREMPAGAVFGEVAFVTSSHRTASLHVVGGPARLALLSQRVADRFRDPGDAAVFWRNLAVVTAGRVAEWTGPPGPEPAPSRSSAA